jgi:hypothetical protein
MMGPIDYTTQVQQPFEAGMQGFQAGFGIRNALDQRQMQQQAMQAAQAKQAQAQADQQRMNEAMAEAVDDPRKLPALMIQFPQFADKWKHGVEALTQQERQAQISTFSDISNALASGRTDIAVSLIKRDAAARRNSGMEDQAKAAEAMAAVTEQDPQAALFTYLGRLNGIPGGEKVAEGISKLWAEKRLQRGEARTEQLHGPAVQQAQEQARLTGAQATTAQVAAANAPTATGLANAATAAGTAAVVAGTRNTESMIAERGAQIQLAVRRFGLDAQRLWFDRDKFTSETQMRMAEFSQASTKLPDDARKLVNESVVASVAAEASGERMLALASKLEDAGGSEGLAGKGWELVKRSFGGEDGITALRKEYDGIKMTEVMKFLPPGAASNYEMQLAMKPFPDSTADAKLVADWLRGRAKLANYAAALESAKSEWVNANGSLGGARKEMSVGGVKVPTGANFDSFARQFVHGKADAIQSQQSMRYVRQAPYLAPYLQQPAGTSDPTHGAPYVAP